MFITIDTNGKNKLTILIRGIIIIAAFVIIAIVPEATITVTLKKELFKKTYPFTLDYTLQTPLIEINRINATDIKKIPPNEGENKYVFIPKIDAAVPKKSIENFLTEKIMTEINEETQEIESKSLRYTLTIGEAADYTGEIYAEASVVPKIDQNALASAVAGKKITAAREYLKSIPNFADVSIKPRPSFLLFIPFITNRVHIVAN